MIQVCVENQTLKVFRDQKILRKYSVSSALNGIGNKIDSGQTPLGKHRICEKIGEGAAIGTVFQGRNNKGIISNIYKSRNEYPYKVESECITSRILRLEGLEDGINKGDGIDSFQRFIYIHGTPYEYAIGQASSKGCIRMTNAAVIELFDSVCIGEEVDILNGGS